MPLVLDKPCDCGGDYVLDPETLDRALVEFPCQRCDWVWTTPRTEFERRADRQGIDIEEARA